MVQPPAGDDEFRAAVDGPGGCDVSRMGEVRAMPPCHNLLEHLAHGAPFVNAPDGLAQQRRYRQHGQVAHHLLCAQGAPESVTTTSE